MAKTWNIRWISYWGFGAGLIYGVVDQFFCRISEAHALRADWPHRQAHGRGDGLRGQDNPSPARDGPLASLQDDVIVATARYWGRYAGHMLAEPLRIIRQRDSEMKPDIVNE
jgi:hypothetical protein